MKLYTKTGDNGTTFIPCLGRVPKDNLIVHIIGELDELNAWIGLLKENDIFKNEYIILKKIQSDLFTIGTKIVSNKNDIGDINVGLLEHQIDQLTAETPELKNFILPSHPASPHIARAICRRVERSLVTLNGNQSNIIYLNRLSDYLFALARMYSTKEDIWKMDS